VLEEFEALMVRPGTFALKGDPELGILRGEVWSDLTPIVSLSILNPLWIRISDCKSGKAGALDSACSERRGVSTYPGAPDCLFAK
jgi:hypothetical protein